MKTIELSKWVSGFAENKDLARQIRLEEIRPVLEQGEEVTLDFTSVTAVTQSFIHALISELIREFGADVLDRIYFSNCSLPVKGIIEIVVEYMQEGVS